MTEHLTKMFDDSFEEAFKKTPPGMAHLAGTGPTGRRCCQCERFYYDKGKPEYWAVSNKLAANTLKPARCGKYREMTKQKGAKFPAHTPACKYFEKSPNPPPMTRSWRA